MKTQKFKTNSGSFQNLMMSNNSTLPVAGEYCTFMHYTDRTVGLVRSVSEDGKVVTIESCDTVADLPEGLEHLPIGHQSWKHTPTGHTYQIVWFRGKWRKVYNGVTFTDEFRASVPDEFIGIWLRQNNPELADKVYNGHTMPSVVVEGVTRSKKSYEPVRVLFGKADYCYDWEF